MKYILTRWFGVFVHDGKKILDYRLFPKDVKEITVRLEMISNGEVLTEEKDLAKQGEIMTDDKRLSGLFEYGEKIPTLHVDPRDYGFDLDTLRETLISITRGKMERELGRDDIHIIQIVKNINEITKISNILSERLREWNSLYVYEGKEVVEKLKEEVEKSIDALKEILNDKMMNLAPNLSNLVGSMLGAELISRAGGLEKLAKLPSSAIQVLGAEKALFRYKQGRGSPPKHGIIFRSPYIRFTKIGYRGKISRILSSKISIAAKADAFTGNTVYKRLKDEIEKFLESI